MGSNDKKPNIVFYTIYMTVIFLAITMGIIWGFGSSFFMRAISLYPNGTLVISEAILSALILVVMLIFKNSYVFSQKKEPLNVGLKYGMFYIILGSLFVIIFGSGGAFHNPYSVANTIIGCLLVGIAEEFLCRGWLLNEFLERFGDTKKGIWYSIIVSGMIFGIIHLMNIYTTGQNATLTILQAINAAGSGIVFGVIYYKTKNIWSVILLHAYWDFSLFLRDLIPVTSNISTSVTVTSQGIIMSLLSVLAVLIIIVPYIKNIDAKPSNKKIVAASIVAAILYFSTILPDNSMYIAEDTYDYDSIAITNYSVTRDNYDQYSISENDIELIVSSNEVNKLNITNAYTNYSVSIDCNNLYDYIVLEEEDYYVIAYEDYIDSTNVFLHYVYIDKLSLSDDELFLENIKSSFQKYLISDISELLIIGDAYNDKSYVAAYSQDYGYYLLTGNKVSILNRD